MADQNKPNQLGQRVLRFAVSGALLFSSAGVTACGADETYVNEPAPEPPTPNAPVQQEEEEPTPNAPFPEEQAQGGEVEAEGEPAPATRMPQEGSLEE